MDLPDPGIEPGFPALQTDSLPTDLSGKPPYELMFFEMLSVRHFDMKVKMLSSIEDIDYSCWVLGGTTNTESVN